MSQPETCCDRTPTRPERCPNGPLGGHPPTPTSKPLLGVHNLSSTSYELDGVSGTYGPSYVGRRVSRQQINQLPPTPRGATNWSPPLGRTIAKISQRLDFTSPSLFRKLNDISLCPPRFLRAETWRNLQEAPTARRSGLPYCGPSQSLISRSPAISANRCGGCPVATHQFRLCS